MYSKPQIIYEDFFGFDDGRNDFDLFGDLFGDMNINIKNKNKGVSMKDPNNPKNISNIDLLSGFDWIMETLFV